MTLTCNLGIDKVTAAKDLRETSLSSKFIVQTRRHTHIGPTALPGPLMLGTHTRVHGRRSTLPREHGPSIRPVITGRMYRV